jgi:5-methyltetrahydrofolate--homocysteine methyltransferase
MVWHGHRQQTEKATDRSNLALSDYIAPRHTHVRDWIGVFAVTTGLGCEERAHAFEAAHDDYSAIMLKAIADRLAEAFAERLHERVRREFWGYAADENLDIEALVAEQYRGIRPAPGYPACPDHAAKADLFDLLDAPSVGMGITESFAMTPPASVAGFFMSHPEARYFAVGPIGQDQGEDFARRTLAARNRAEQQLQVAA